MFKWVIGIPVAIVLVFALWFVGSLLWFIGRWIYWAFVDPNPIDNRPYQNNEDSDADQQ